MNDIRIIEAESEKPKVENRKAENRRKGNIVLEKGLVIITYAPIVFVTTYLSMMFETFSVLSWNSNGS